MINCTYKSLPGKHCKPQFVLRLYLTWLSTTAALVSNPTGVESKVFNLHTELVLGQLVCIKLYSVRGLGMTFLCFRNILCVA